MQFATFGRMALRTLPLWIGLSSLWADVTVRYQWDMKFPPSMPAQLQEQAKAGLAGQQGMALYFKNGRNYSKFAKMVAITDYTGKKVTLIDPEHKTYSTVAYEEFADKMTAWLAGAVPEIPADAKKAMAETKTTITSKQVDTSDVIQGVQTDKREVVFTIVPPGGTGMTMKMVMEFWSAKPSETLRVQAVRELAGYNLYAHQFMNPIEGIKKMLNTFGGMGDTQKSLFEEFSKNNSLVLRIKMSHYMQFPPEMLKAMGDKSPFGPNYDPNAPMSEMTGEVTELTTASVDEKLFQIPEGFQAGRMEDLVKSMMAGMMPAGATAK